MNYDNPRVRKEIVEAIRLWRSLGADGFVVENAYFSPHIDGNDSKNYADAFDNGAALYRILREIEEKFSGNFPILISDGISPDLYPRLTKGSAPVSNGILLAGLMSEISMGKFSFKYFLKKYLSLQRDNDGLFLAFGDENHDRLLSKVSRSRFLPLAAKMLGTLLLCAAPIPVIYQGEEIGMTDLPKKLFDKSITQSHLNARSPFQWDNKTNAGFTASPFSYLPVNENYHEINSVAEAADPESPLSFYRRMIAFRKSSSALCEGEFQDCSKGDVFAFLRTSSTQRLFIIVNTLSEHLNYTVPKAFWGMNAECVLASCALVGKTLHSTMGLRPYEVRIYSLSAE